MQLFVQVADAFAELRRSAKDGVKTVPYTCVCEGIADSVLAETEISKVFKSCKATISLWVDFI